MVNCVMPSCLWCLYYSFAAQVDPPAADVTTGYMLITRLYVCSVCVFACTFLLGLLLYSVCPMLGEQID